MQGERMRTLLAVGWILILLFYSVAVTPAARGWSLGMKSYQPLASVASPYTQSVTIEATAETAEPPLQSQPPGLSSQPTKVYSPPPAGEAHRTPSRHEKLAYLTFDDGPSALVTPIILQVLREHQVKATFFVIGCYAERHPELLRQMAAEGHAVGNHSYSHRIKQIYSSREALLKDIDQCEQVLSDILGNHPKIFRPPGGSIPHLGQPLAAGLKEAGFEYFDWNVCPGDSLKDPPALEQLIAITLMQASDKDRIVILLHDAKTMNNTAIALPKIISGLKAMGFTFKTIDQQTEPIHFSQR